MVRARLLAIAALGLWSACAPRSRPVVPVGPPPAVRMAAAEAEFRDGCLDCLERALAQYLTLRSDQTVGPAATQSAARAALLIAVRENELGLLDS